jgi:hypothetical protein
MRNTWVCKVGMIALVGELCLVGYGQAHADVSDCVKLPPS